MRFQIRNLATGALVVLSLTLGSAAQAGKAGGKGNWHEKMATELSLTPEQKEKMKQVHQSNREAMQSKRKALKAAREGLETSLQGTASDDELRKKFSELEKVQADFGKARFDKILAMRAILTPEQRQKFKGMRKEHRGFRNQGSDSEDDDE